MILYAMSDAVPQNPYAAPNVSSIEKRGTITSLDDVISYAQSKQQKSFFCNFISRLAEQDPKAVESFLDRYVNKDSEGQKSFFPKSLQNYAIPATGDNMKAISETQALKNTIDDFSQTISRRSFVSSITSGAGIFILGGSLLLKTALQYSESSNGKGSANNDQSQKSTRESLHAAGNMGTLIGGILLAIGGGHNERNNNQAEALQFLENGHCSIDDFDQFIGKCDKHIIQSMKRLVEQGGPQEQPSSQR